MNPPRRSPRPFQSKGFVLIPVCGEERAASAEVDKRTAVGNKHGGQRSPKRALSAGSAPGPGRALRGRGGGAEPGPRSLEPRPVRGKRLAQRPGHAGRGSAGRSRGLRRWQRRGCCEPHRAGREPPRGPRSRRFSGQPGPAPPLPHGGTFPAEISSRSHLYELKTIPLTREHNSQLNGGRIPVCGVTFQEPENDPGNSCYLWAVQSTPKRGGGVLSFRLLQLTFGKRRCVASGQVMYEGLARCEERFSLDLRDGNFPWAGQNSNMKLLGCQTIESFSDDVDEDNSINGGLF
ncbi:uncharacterized protein LOC128852134 [Cuculus canorus]|uniref:uncharacterized protein LOC128852134 n=1 Tax=Cuculus canorus TaxID=55661 RepID=UPI0023AB4A89|nr:uncharacterized protein LOC128852134 [Cuculus canorus]